VGDGGKTLMLAILHADPVPTADTRLTCSRVQAVAPTEEDPMRGGDCCGVRAIREIPRPRYFTTIAREDMR